MPKKSLNPSSPKNPKTLIPSAVRQSPNTSPQKTSTQKTVVPIITEELNGYYDKVVKEYWGTDQKHYNIFKIGLKLRSQNDHSPEVVYVPIEHPSNIILDYDKDSNANPLRRKKIHCYSITNVANTKNTHGTITKNKLPKITPGIVHDVVFTATKLSDNIDEDIKLTFAILDKLKLPYSVGIENSNLDKLPKVNGCKDYRCKPWFYYNNKTKLVENNPNINFLCIFNAHPLKRGFFAKTENELHDKFIKPLMEQIYHPDRLKRLGMFNNFDFGKRKQNKGKINKLNKINKLIRQIDMILHNS